MTDEQVNLVQNPVLYQRGNSRVEWLPAPGRWYWELRLDDDPHGEAIAGLQWTHRAACRAMRRAARREGIAP